MYAYGAIAPAELNDKRQFLYDLENSAIDKVVMKDKFNTIDTTRMLWGLAKFTNRNLNPYWNEDGASCVLNRFSLAKVKSVQHRLPRLFTTEILA
mgnify:CR=1 FL=1